MIKINYEINGSLKDLKEKYIQTFIGKGRNKGNQSNTDFNNTLRPINFHLPPFF